MKTIKWSVNMRSYSNIVIDGEFEMPSDTTVEEIEEEVKNIALNEIEWGWEVL